MCVLLMNNSILIQRNMMATGYITRHDGIMFILTLNIMRFYQACYYRSRIPVPTFSVKLCVTKLSTDSVNN
jgi:hypothetical protein